MQETKLYKRTRINKIVIINEGILTINKCICLCAGILIAKENDILTLYLNLSTTARNAAHPALSMSPLSDSSAHATRGRAGGGIHRQRHFKELHHTWTFQNRTQTVSVSAVPGKQKRSRCFGASQCEVKSTATQLGEH